MNQWGKYSGHYKSPLIDIIKIHPIPIHLLSINISRDSSRSLLKPNQSSVNGKSILSSSNILEAASSTASKNLRKYGFSLIIVLYTQTMEPHNLYCVNPNMCPVAILKLAEPR